MCKQENNFFTFTTKATTLHTLRPILNTAKVLPVFLFTIEEYRTQPQTIIHLLSEQYSEKQRLIVRSSAKNEDTNESSNAGKFLSIGNVCGESALRDAIEQVAESMGEDIKNQIFIQPYLQDVTMCGVVFTADPNTGGHYYVFNYDAKTGSTCSVTNGTGTKLEVYYHFKKAPFLPPVPLDRVVLLCQELESLFQNETLDIEFAFAKGELYLFQVRPLVLHKPLVPLEKQEQALHQMKQKLTHAMQRHPELYGERSIYGIMPDWNPAEMIGIRPKPLALSLYKEIITNGVWAYQRDNYGYRNLRSFPLMLDFQGLPYIDTRVSFNSFLPKQLSEEVGEKLTNYYLQRLQRHPEYHDKIEFEIAFTCYTFDLPERICVLREHGFSEQEQQQLMDALRELTNNIIAEDGLWKKDAKKIEILKQKHDTIMNSNLRTEDQIYWLLEYCKRYGTLPFAGLARAGFIAVELLRSMVSMGILTEQDRYAYMGKLSTVGKNMSKDRLRLSQTEFFAQYGHLRPGTYDICSARYDQNQEAYFGNHFQEQPQQDHTPFRLTLMQFEKIQNMLTEHGLHIDVLSLFAFIKGAIEGREYAKFVFTKTLSDVLELLANLGTQYGYTREELSYFNIRQILDQYSSACDLQELIASSIASGKKQDEIVTCLVLPPIVWDEKQIYSFSLPDGTPNFITQRSCTAEIVVLPTKSNIEGKVVLIQGADPGYDWIFSHNIAGFVTAYGGANSHMAIRAAEFDLPAVIGVGEKQFARYAQAKILTIDCRNKTVVML